MTLPESAEKGGGAHLTGANGGKAWVQGFTKLSRMDKYVFFEELLDACDEPTQEMLVTACKKLPIYFEMEQDATNSSNSRNRGAGSYDSRDRRHSSHDEDGINNRSRTSSIQSRRSEAERAFEEEYEEEYEEEEDEEQNDMYGYDYEDEDEDEDDLEESDEDDFVSGSPSAYQAGDSRENELIADHQANRELVLTYGSDGNDGFLGVLLNHCHCDLLDFLINPLPREFGVLKCFLWYDRKEARINLYLDGKKPTLLMEARCTSRSHGKLEFSGNLPQWHGAMTVFELHQVQASHVSHFNVFDGRRLPVKQGVRTERLAQRPHVVAGAGGGFYSRLRSGPVSPTGADAGPIQLGAIQIKSISTKPREIMVLTPRLVEYSSMGGTGQPPQKERQSKRWDSPAVAEQMLQVALGGEREDLCIMHSREATFDEATQAYTMDFGERVKTASSKNIILQEHNGDGTTKIMTGKIGGMQYAVDLAYPVSLTHAFAVAIANITTKTVSVK